ncbi:hypothetical protein D3C78_1022960 [compost metagenome]
MDHRAPTRQNNHSVRVVQLQIELVRLKAPVVGQRQAHQARVHHRRHIPAFDGDTERRAFAGKVHETGIQIHDSSPPAIFFTLPMADVAVSCRLLSWSLRLPNISESDSSTRFRVSVNSIRRGIPLSKNSVLA